jgi:uncharacterized caspase-like protein
MAKRDAPSEYTATFNPVRRNILQSVAAAGMMSLIPSLAFAQPSPVLYRMPRHALVIGNSRYASAPLENPGNDAIAIAAQLKGSGFEVQVHLDAGRQTMLGAIDDYANQLASRNAVGLFYFAGHGAQLAWRNYLIPVDAAIRSLDDLPTRAVELNALLSGLGKAKNPMNVIVLDACRDNPFGDELPTEQKGLSQFDAPPGSLLAYATSPGNVASDGQGINGLYTEHLLRELRIPEAKIEDVFKRVRLAVRKRSNGGQIPWESTSLEEDFYFHPPRDSANPTEVVATRRFEEELSIWEGIKSATTPGPLEDYLRRYPSGLFSELAALRLDQVLSRAGERRIHVLSDDRNPYSKGTLRIDTRVRIGDRYSYREVDLETNQDVRKYTLLVSDITDTEVIYGKGSFVTDLIGNWIKLGDGRVFTGAQYFVPDYSIGKRWTSRHRVANAKGEPYDTVYDFKVVARESKTVPAGTFDAFRVEGSGWTRGPSGSIALKSRYWVTPDVRRFIEAHFWQKHAKGKVLENKRIELISFAQQ